MLQPPSRESKGAGDSPGTGGAPRQKRPPLLERKITITMGLPKAVFSLAFSLCILVWAFIFGIMLGRGHNPEEMVPELARVMPSSQAVAAAPGLTSSSQASLPQTQSGQPSSGQGQSGQTPSSQAATGQAASGPVPQTSAEAMREVLRPQDLHFHDTLKSGSKEKPQPAPARQTPQGKESAKEAAAKEAAAKNTAAKKAAIKEAAAKEAAAKEAAARNAKPTPAAKPAPNTAAPAAGQEDPDQKVYDYIYQVAAFTDAAQAQAMRKKLQDSGLAAQVSQGDARGTTWYRIVVSFKGKPEETRRLRAKLAEHGITNLILRSKNPAK